MGPDARRVPTCAPRPYQPADLHEHGSDSTSQAVHVDGMHLRRRQLAGSIDLVAQASCRGLQSPFRPHDRLPEQPGHLVQGEQHPEGGKRLVSRFGVGAPSSAVGERRALPRAEAVERDATVPSDRSEFGVDRTPVVAGEWWHAAPAGLSTGKSAPRVNGSATQHSPAHAEQSARNGAEGVTTWTVLHCRSSIQDARGVRTGIEPGPPRGRARRRAHDALAISS